MFEDVVAKDNTCLIFRDGKPAYQNGFDVFGEAVEWVHSRAVLTKAISQWEIMLASGYYELSLSEFRKLCSISVLHVVGSGVVQEVPTVIRLFGFTPAHLLEIGKLSRRLNYEGLRIEI